MERGGRPLALPTGEEEGVSRPVMWKDGWPMWGVGKAAGKGLLPACEGVGGSVGGCDGLADPHPIAPPHL